MSQNTSSRTTGAHPLLPFIATLGLIGLLLITETTHVIIGSGLLLLSLYTAYKADKAQHHEHLGLGSEALLYEDGAEDTECPACETIVPIRPDKDFPDPTGGTICAECGSTVASDGENVKLMTRNDDWFNK